MVDWTQERECGLGEIVQVLHVRRGQAVKTGIELRWQPVIWWRIFGDLTCSGCIEWRL